MTYEAEISRENRALIVFLLDQSTSMAEAWSAGEGHKADGLADIINRFLGSLVIRSTKDEGVRDYFEIAMIGYGQRVSDAWEGSLAGQYAHPIPVVADTPLRVDERRRKVSDGAGGLVETTFRLPVWVEVQANGGTPMCEAMGKAAEIVGAWTSDPDHEGGFPPIVINITDGEATDGDPAPMADEIRSCATNDGNALLFNVHISSASGSAVAFPSAAELLSDPYARALFAMSSELTPAMLQEAKREGFTAAPHARGMVFQSDPVQLIQFLEIGTRTPTLR